MLRPMSLSGFQQGEAWHICKKRLLPHRLSKRQTNSERERESDGDDFCLTFFENEIFFVVFPPIEARWRHMAGANDDGDDRNNRRIASQSTDVPGKRGNEDASSLVEVPCSICLELVVDDGTRSMAKLQCGHQFHLGTSSISDQSNFPFVDLSLVSFFLHFHYQKWVRSFVWSCFLLILIPGCSSISS